MTEITDEMVEAACRAYWPMHWPAKFAQSDAESIKGHIRKALEAVAPLIEAQAIERCAQVADEYYSRIPPPLTL